MRAIRAVLGARTSWRSGRATDQTSQRASIGSAPRRLMTAGCLAAVSWMADSEAAGMPMPPVPVESLIKGRAEFGRDASPRLDDEQITSAVERPQAREAKDYFAVASIACAALCACVTTVFLVFALP